MDTVTCCCCGQCVEFTEEVIESWEPGVYHENDYLGEMCPRCACTVGLRYSNEEEMFYNMRIMSYETFLDIRKNGR